MSRPVWPGSGDAQFWAVLAIAATVRAAMLWVACCVAAALWWQFGHQGLRAFNHDTADMAAGLGVVAATSVGVVLAGRSLVRAARATVAFRQQVRGRMVPLPPQVSAAARDTGLVGRVEMITSPVAFALTYGLARPRVLVSSALVQALQPHEVRAVLTHEAEHVRGRDPLRTLILRIVSARLFYLPILGHLRQRFTLVCELAADRRARATCGIAAVAGHC
jgi:Zn-dependent protease with chaperone function